MRQAGPVQAPARLRICQRGYQHPRAVLISGGEGTKDCQARFLGMDREAILREPAKLEDRIARTRHQITYYREIVSRLEQSGRAVSAEFMVRQCDHLLALHMSMHAMLTEQLSWTAG